MVGRKLRVLRRKTDEEALIYEDLPSTSDNDVGVPFAAE